MGWKTMEMDNNKRMPSMPFRKEREEGTGEPKVEQPKNDTHFIMGGWQQSILIK